MRKIRVFCSDPYATDYSSDDEDSIGANEPTIGKLFVHEISLSRPTSDSGTFSVLMGQKGHSDASDSSRKDGPAKDGPICIYQENDGSVSENNGNLNRAKYPGLRMTASGKWGVQLSRPFKEWCGSYNTIEEAINGCKKKKIELAMLRGLIVKNDVLEEKHMANHRRQKLVVDDMTVLETVSGKWAAWIRKKASNAKTWLGLYATREEAMESYSRMKLKLDSNCNLKSPGKGSSSVQGNPQDAVVNDTAQDIASPTDTDVASFRRPGMKLTRKGKWGVRIQHPRMDSRQWLGSYDTLEEAAEVYDKKKIELEESCVAEKEIPARGASTEVIDSQGHRVRYKGVRLRTSGRWSAETRDPRKRRKVHLGTYDTPEEAAAVYNKHRRQLEARICQGKTRSLKDIAEAETVTLPSETVAFIPEAVVIDAVVKTEPNNASPALTLEAENSTVTAVSGQDSEGSNTNNDNQIPSSSLEDEDELGLGVINCHGQYVGEYSKMDDELLII